MLHPIDIRTREPTSGVNTSGVNTSDIFTFSLRYTLETCKSSRDGKLRNERYTGFGLYTQITQTHRNRGRLVGGLAFLPEAVVEEVAQARQPIPIAQSVHAVRLVRTGDYFAPFIHVDIAKDVLDFWDTAEAWDFPKVVYGHKRIGERSSLNDEGEVVMYIQGNLRLECRDEVFIILEIGRVDLGVRAVAYWHCIFVW